MLTCSGSRPQYMERLCSAATDDVDSRMRAVAFLPLRVAVPPSGGNLSLFGLQTRTCKRTTNYL